MPKKIDKTITNKDDEISQYIVSSSKSDIVEETVAAETRSRRKTTKKNDVVEPNTADGEKFVTKAVDVVIHESMLPYSEYVILDRALPRVEDGLKPVQRRVLYSMLEVGVLPDRPYRKSARIVGDCMGKYHPHGDKSIYDTMVRLAQPFNMGEVLVDGHGNYGSVDGDGAAAMRYTEARLAPLSLELLRDIEKDTVSWSLNFDDSCKEPDMLPGRFPNLLVNGSMGIAVGLATNIPPHNLREACQAACAYIDNNNITLKQLMKIMKGPDFPTGAYILNSSELDKVYATGKGKIVIRSKFHIENAENDKKNIVFTEIPYQVNKSALLQRIAAVKENDETGDLAYIQDIVDESDRQGTRAVIKLKKDAKIQNILNILFKQTDLETSFNANMVAIADGKPRQLTLIDYLKYYVNYQKKVIYNRTKFDLEACLKKEHILEGLLIAIKNIDEVVKIIKKSKSVTDAKITLINRFKLTDVQAQAILDMRLARLTNLEVEKLVTELNRLKDLIARYTAILKSDSMQLKIVKQELSEIAKKYGSDRKTEFIDGEEFEIVETAGKGDEIAEDVHIITTPIATIKAVNKKSYNLATKDISSNATLQEIPQTSRLFSADSTMFIFTNLGNSVQIKISKINQCKFRDKGLSLGSYVKGIANNEKIVSVMELNENMKDDILIFYTKQGLIKKTLVSEYLCSKSLIAGIKLKDKDELIGVEVDNKDSQLAIFTKFGIGMLVPKDDIAATGRVSSGVKGIALSDGDVVVGAMQLAKDDAVSIFASNGLMHTIKYKDIPQSLRNKKGSKIITVKSGEPQLVRAYKLQPNVNFAAEIDNNKLKFVKNSAIPVVKPLDKSLKISKPVKVTDVYQFVISE